MMFVKENAHLLQKHYPQLRLDDSSAGKYAHLLGEEMKFLPGVFVKNEEDADIGKND